MSRLSPQIAMLEALGSALHQVAEERMPRVGKVAPGPAFFDENAARFLGSFAQACERAALQLHEQERQMAEMVK